MLLTVGRDHAWLTLPFTGPGCSQKHIPSYLMHPGLKGAGKVFVVSVNDPFVMKAWGDLLDPDGLIGVRA